MLRENIRPRRRLNREEMGIEEEPGRSTERHFDEIRRAVQELQDESSDLASNEVQFTVAATDPEREIVVAHGLGRPPRRWKVTYQDGFGSLKVSRKRLGSRTNLFFKTDAEQGTVFCVVPYAE